jgi:glutamate N-acetyltransferase/amino-acid N-acetyltransferase
MSYTIFDDGHISSPSGYRATGVSCGMKDGTRARDLALVYSLHPCKVGALFTTSLTKAAPVFLSQAILSRNRETIRAVLINSGQANAGTGQPGLTDAVECAKLVADELEIQRDGVVLMSTGVIGAALPMSRMRDGIRRAVSELDSGGGKRAAVAMLTTDTRPKERALRVQLAEGQRVTLAGMAKGTRMIHPRLGTLLCVITTDAAIDQRLLQACLQQSAGKSFDRLNLDGDSSPNDSVLIMANGASGAPPIAGGSRELANFQEALDALCADLSQQILRDAAGNGKVIGVRSALRRGTCDWGPILAAVGASGAELRPELLGLRVAGIAVFQEGQAVPFDSAAAIQAFSSPEVEFTVELNAGPVELNVWTCTWHEE